MPTCETCGNDYDRTFEVKMAGSSHTFDSFECAVQALAPRCPVCGVRILGHGVQQGEDIFCCAHCAGKQGSSNLKDRA